MQISILLILLHVKSSKFTIYNVNLLLLIADYYCENTAQSFGIG